MNDRELLELAAKAAGYGVKPHASQKHTPHLMFTFNGHNWNPLTDDGDALRLAVKLGIDIRQHHRGASAAQGSIDCTELFQDRNLPLSALMESTRRAIVRAAAAIGKEMK